MDNQAQESPKEYVPWASYWPDYPQFFPNRESASHFIQTRKLRMKHLGLLVEGARGYIVHKRRLDTMLVTLLARGSADAPIDPTVLIGEEIRRLVSAGVPTDAILTKLMEVSG
jgi:hypothetical protein